jgi:hypothetical protein
MALITIIEDCMLHQDLVSMESRTPPGSRYMALARIQDQLGWDCFIKEQIPIFLIETVCPFLLNWSTQKSIMRWGVFLLKSLLSVTHKQWLFRNSDVHHIINGLTTHQHALLNQRIHDLIQTTPKELLPMHCHLLQQDFAQLGNVDTLQQQIWVASMESAFGAASHFSSGHLTPGSLHRFFCPQSHPCLSPSGTIPSRQTN